MVTDSDLKCLVIGYGNELRGDDSLGPRLARAIEARRFPGVRVITAHQLTPEMAEDLSETDLVAFLDASTDSSDKVRTVPITPAPATQVWAHASGPAVLLTWAAQLFGKQPKAILITVPGTDFGYSQTLSRQAESAMPAALEEFERGLNAWRAQSMGEPQCTQPNLL